MADTYASNRKGLSRPMDAVARLGWLALLLAIVGLVLALQAQHHASQALDRTTQLNQKLSHLQTQVNTSLGNDTTASPGSGSGANTTQPVPSTNTTPNGNGQ